MKTVINTIGDNEYDLDDGVYIQGYDDVELEDWPVASTVHKWVKDAVSERTKKILLIKRLVFVLLMQMDIILTCQCTL